MSSGQVQALSFPDELALRRSEELEEYEGLASGLATLDGLLPGGGVPRGKLSELSGSRSCGKRALAQRFCLQALDDAQNVVWIDGSRAVAKTQGRAVGRFFPLLALEQGHSLARLLVVRPPDAAAVFKAVDLVLTASGAAALVVVDLPSGAIQQRQLSRLPRIARGAAKSGTAVLFVTERCEQRSLGTFISLQLWVEREVGQARLTIIKSKLGRMAHSARVVLDGSHGVYLDSSV